MAEDSCRITPAASLKSSSVSLFNSLKRRPSKEAKAKHLLASRPPPGFVSYQIPSQGAGLGAPSDNIPRRAPSDVRSGGSSGPSDNISSYDPPRSRYSASAASLASRGHNKARGQLLVELGGGQQQPQPPTAGVHPNHLHNGGRPYKSSVNVKQSDSPSTLPPPPPPPPSHPAPSPPGYEPPPPPWPDTQDTADQIYSGATPRSGHKYTGEGGKKYRKSPIPVLKSPVWVQEPEDEIDQDQESVRSRSSGSPDYYHRPRDSEDPRPPPRSRPKSWTSTLFAAFRYGTSRHQSAGPPSSGTPAGSWRRQREMSSVTLSSAVSQATSSKTSYRFTKQVRFLANPKKLHPGQKFYSLPHFAKPAPAPGLPVPESDSKAKARSRSPSPFGRFVKSFVKGNRGNPGKCVNLNIFPLAVLLIPDLDWREQELGAGFRQSGVVCRCVA